MDFFTGNGHLKDYQKFPNQKTFMLSYCWSNRLILSIKKIEEIQIKIPAVQVLTRHQCSVKKNFQTVSDVHCDRHVERCKRRPFIKRATILTPIAATDLGLNLVFQYWSWTNLVPYSAMSAQYLTISWSSYQRTRTKLLILYLVNVHITKKKRIWMAIELANKIFKPSRNGGPIIMLIILTSIGFTIWSEIPKALKVVSNLPSPLLGYRCYHRRSTELLASLCKIGKKYWYLIEHHCGAPTCNHHLGVCMDTLLLLVMLLSTLWCLQWRKTDTSLDVDNLRYLAPWSITGLPFWSNGTQTTMELAKGFHPFIAP